MGKGGTESEGACKCGGRRAGGAVMSERVRVKMSVYVREDECARS